MALPCGGDPGHDAADPVVAPKYFSLPQRGLETKDRGNIAGLDGFLQMVVGLTGAQGARFGP